MASRPQRYPQAGAAGKVWRWQLLSHIGDFALYLAEEFSDDTEKLGETLPETNNSPAERSMVGSWKMKFAF